MRWSVLIVLGLAAAIFVSIRTIPPRVPLRSSQLDSPPHEIRTGFVNRRIYPFSIIPGGVRSATELRTALDSDQVAAAHYAGFQVSLAKTVALEASRRAYVSFRIGDEVYWTRNKLTLPEGELLLTDGTEYARARCGNRLSETPQEPTTPNEPPLLVIDTPVLPGPGPLIVDLFAPPDYIAAATPPLPFAEVPDAPLPRKPLPPMEWNLPVEGSSPPLIHPKPPFRATPEPGSFFLILIPIGFVFFYRRHSFSRH